MIFKNSIVKFSPDFSKIIADIEIEGEYENENYGFQIGESLFGVLSVDSYYGAECLLTIYEIDTLLIKCQI